MGSMYVHIWACTEIQRALCVRVCVGACVYGHRGGDMAPIHLHTELSPLHTPSLPIIPHTHAHVHARTYTNLHEPIQHTNKLEPQTTHANSRHLVGALGVPHMSMLRFVAVCCSVLQCVAVCCSVLWENVLGVPPTHANEPRHRKHSHDQAHYANDFI